MAPSRRSCRSSRYREPRLCTPKSPHKTIVQRIWAELAGELGHGGGVWSPETCCQSLESGVWGPPPGTRLFPSRPQTPGPIARRPASSRPKREPAGSCARPVSGASFRLSSPLGTGLRPPASPPSSAYSSSLFVSSRRWRLESGDPRVPDRRLVESPYKSIIQRKWARRSRIVECQFGLPGRRAAGKSGWGLESGVRGILTGTRHFGRPVREEVSR
jgi:hypothetical protein